ncbi:probable protein phosphatase 2C 72 [Papaver somniferum]|nr:probable protein phosphatase 2C 72 [Papaver somniferum]
MGICMSCASYSNPDESIIHDTYENAVIIDSRSDRTPSLIGSVYSQKGDKATNQDSSILQQGFAMNDGALCGVFDEHGMNGHVASILVRELLPSLLLDQKKSISSSTDGNDYVEEWSKACVGAYQVMDDELKSRRENLDFSCSGTTSVTVIKQGEDLVIANLGDSRAVLGTSSDNGEFMAVQLTTDLKPSVIEEAERIRSRRGRVFALQREAHIERVWLPNEDYPGLAMTRAFGDFELKDYGIIATPQISHHHLNIKDKFVVLASDGVWDMLSNDQVVSIMSSSRPETAAKAVVEAAVAGWKRFPHLKMDDISVSCMFFHEIPQNL